MGLLVALLLLLLAAANYLRHRDVLYPGFLQACVWLAALLLLLAHRRTFVPVSDGVLGLLLAGVAMFSLGAFVATRGHQPSRARTSVGANSLPPSAVRWALGVVTAVGLLLFLQRAAGLAAAGPSNNAFVNLRLAVSVYQGETGGFGLVQYFVTLANVLMAIVLLSRYGSPPPHASRTAAGVSVLAALAFGILTSGRGPVLAVLIIALAIPLALRAATPAATGIGLGVVALALFAAVGLALGKGGDLAGSLADNWTTLRESLVTYSVGGIPALGAFLDARGPDLEWGANAFRTVAAVLRQLGFDVAVPDLVQPFVDIPMPFNVYTVYQPYIKDVGVAGSLVVLFALGFGHGILYRRATAATPHALAVYLFACSLFPLAMQAFQDMYFSLLSLWIQYVAWGLLFFVMIPAGRAAWAVRSPVPA